MLHDIRIAARSLVKSPAFAFTVVVVLALGIGANSAIFGLVNQVLLSPPGISDPGRLVAIRARYDKLNMPSISISGPDYDDVRGATDVVESMAVVQGNTVVLGGGTAPQPLRSASVSVRWFDVFGARPLIGRPFTPEEDRAGGDPVVILAHAAWARLFGSDPGIVSQKIQLDEKPYKVVGVMEADFRWPREVEVWLPLRLPDVELTANYRFNEHLLGVARLRPGVSLAQANTRVRALADRVRAGTGEDSVFARDSQWGMFAVPLTTFIAGDTRAPLLVLFGAVGCVLLIACANIAGLMLARAAGRSREIAIRAAMGAGRRHLLRQTLIESLLLSSAGGVAGLGFTYAGMRLLLASAPPGAVIGLQPRIDTVVVAFTAIASIVAGLLFAVVPAWQVSRVSPYDVIKGGGYTASASRGRQRLRAALVVSEIALAMILLVGSGLLIRSLSHVEDVSPGFEPRGVVAAGVSLPEARYKDPERRAAFYRALLDRLQGTPAFREAGVATPLPFTNNDSSASFQIEGRPMGPGDPGPHGNSRLATPGYFAALGIPLRRGRTFTADDRLGTDPVVVIDENLARQYWPNQDPIGQRVRGGDRGAWLTIVGIVGHVSHNELVGESDKGTYYQCLLQQTSLGAWVVARMRDGVASQPSLIADAVRSVDPTLPVVRAGTMSDMVWRSLAPRRFVVEVLAFFAAAALLMAALGLYGVISYSVSQRVQEIGIRMALGASRGTVLGFVLGQGFLLAAIGGAAGLVGSVAASRVLASQLYKLSPFDPLTLLLTAAVLLAAALAATYLPARAATRVDPLVALRTE